jgi:uncharacterized protein YdhG (YjbR/CyaY superfamily)
MQEIFLIDQKEISMSPKKETQKSAAPARAGGARKSTTATSRTSKGFSAEEKAAAKARIQELKAEAEKADGESAVLAAIAKMHEPDRSMARRIHAIIKDSAPALSAKTWYGMPAYAGKDGKIICFFQTAQKFNTRYSTFGFNDAANLDEGELWPVAYALKKLTRAEELKIGALVKKAVS